VSPPESQKKDVNGTFYIWLQTKTNTCVKSPADLRKGKPGVRKERMVALKERMGVRKEQTVAPKERMVALKEYTGVWKEWTVALKERMGVRKECTVAPKERSVHWMKNSRVAFGLRTAQSIVIFKS
jgi:hypothetical protein